MTNAGFTHRRRKHWGWGYEDEQPSPETLEELAAGARRHLGLAPAEVESPVPLAALRLAAPRLQAPPELQPSCRSDTYTRASHALGSSYRDVVRGFRGQFADAPDVVAFPRDEAELERVLEWAANAGAAVIPFGGGTSVVGGVEPVVGSTFNGVVTLDTAGLGGVHEVDPVSRAARIGAGALGPALERRLGEHGLTLRHYPQSFQFSSLGGWIATRAAGHFSTALTHIDDLVESIRAITPAGVWESRRLPGSGAGVSPDRMLLGSEGTLGVITEAWMRVRPRPAHRCSQAVRFGHFSAGVEACRALAQSGLHPASARLIEAGEVRTAGAGDGTASLLVLGFEADDDRAREEMTRALAICRQCGGAWDDDAGTSGGGTGGTGGGGTGGTGGGGTGGTGGTGGMGSTGGGGDSVRARSARAEAGNGTEAGVGLWRDAFIRAPYLRDVLVAAGVLCETFETAVTWERFPGFHAVVVAEVQEALREVCGGGTVTCRFTHLYPDGPAAYYTVLAPARRGDELDQWGAVKAAASAAIISGGGTITHHHAVGRDHRPWYDQQRPEIFARALRGAKAAVDPSGIMNPGVLLPAP